MLGTSCVAWEKAISRGKELLEAEVGPEAMKELFPNWCKKGSTL